MPSRIGFVVSFALVAILGLYLYAANGVTGQERSIEDRLATLEAQLLENVQTLQALEVRLQSAPAAQIAALGAGQGPLIDMAITTSERYEWRLYAGDPATPVRGEVRMCATRLFTSPGVLVMSLYGPSEQQTPFIRQVTFRYPEEPSCQDVNLLEVSTIQLRGYGFRLTITPLHCAQCTVTFVGRYP